MLHAREDFARIQDPASNPELLEAYNDAMNLVAHGPRGDGAVDRAPYVALSKLCRALHPTLGLLSDSAGFHLPANPIGADEPVFLLRAHDRYAPDTVDRYSTLVFDRGNGDAELSEDASAQAKRMREWQQAHAAKAPELALDGFEEAHRG